MKRKGFTLIELLIVIAILAVVAAIAIPNLMMTIQRSKQKATMATLKNIGTAVDAYITNVDFAPNPGSNNNMLSDLETTLEPFYIKLLPHRDAWFNFLVYSSASGSVAAERESYTVRSYGRDGIPTAFDITLHPYYVDKMIDFHLDIIYTSGTFSYGPRR